MEINDTLWGRSEINTDGSDNLIDYDSRSLYIAKKKSTEFIELKELIYLFFSVRNYRFNKRRRGVNSADISNS